MTHQAIRLTVALFLTIAVWGCKKEGNSPGAEEPAAVKKPAAETEPVEGDQEEPALPAEPGPEASDESQLAPVVAPAPAPAEEPGVTTVKLATTEGDIIIDVHEDWAPTGVKRFLELVEAGYYTDVAFFRVMEGFMAQAGVSGDPKLNVKWGRKKIKDDIVKRRNKKGTVSFAMAGRNTRTTQFFINLADNTQLDSSGFAPFGKVRDMAVAEKLYTGYGDGPPHGKGPNQSKIKKKGNAYLKAGFPELDYILSATIMK